MANSTIWNLAGQLAPMVVAVAAIPPLVSGLGAQRFGVLSLAWVIVGYFSLFDLGMGRALTKMVADAIGSYNQQAIAGLVWTSLFLMLLLGMLGGLMMAALSPFLVRHLLKIPLDLQTETLRACYLMVLSIPAITVTSGLRGVLEALQRFRMANLIRIPLSIFSYGAPLLTLPFSHSLAWIVGVLLFGRILGCAAHLVACFRALPGIRGKPALSWSLVRPVLAFGGWITVSNVINPILVYADRFVIGVAVSIGMVGFYTAPLDMVVRLMVLPGAVAGVMFPAFALTLGQDPQRAELLLTRSLKYVFLVIFPIALVIVSLAPDILQVWLGPSFAFKSTTVLRWAAAGILANSLAQAPFALVQSAGRPDLTAKLHLIELPLYLAGVWFLTKAMGIEGAAIAWAARLILDTLLIGFIVDRLLGRQFRLAIRLGAATVAGLMFIYLGALPGGRTLKLCFLAAAGMSFAVLAWFRVLDTEERDFLLRWRHTFLA